MPEHIWGIVGTAAGVGAFALMLVAIARVRE